jgi:hypothetical protein
MVTLSGYPVNQTRGGGEDGLQLNCVNVIVNLSLETYL